MNKEHAGYAVGEVAKILLRAKGDMETARAIAYQKGATPRAIRILEKGNVGALTTPADGPTDWNVASAAFFESLRAESVFFNLLDSGLRRVPLMTRVATVTVGASAYSVGEGQPVPLSKLTLTGQQLSQERVAALCVVSDEIARSDDHGALIVVQNELRKAVASVVDQRFFDILIDSSTPSFTSVGSDRAAFRQDMRSVLDATNTRGADDLAFVFGPAAANAAALFDNTGGMSPRGGEILATRALVSDELPDATVLLIAPTRIAAAAGSLRLKVSREATIEMRDNPIQSGVAPTPADLTSLFQNNAVALMSTIEFGVERVRADACAMLTDVAWASTASEGS